eukprot:TRINITY_DN43936_c0_g1_i1.p1 TRINITY_DN43936_c0_g1~~TRINITY_DN43936_c0_g1_i1.p1  ORF type:complete len:325 (+),score=98.26 TRINITY_DN43936_c0_g1_i1:82-1056(+)
MPYDLKRDEAAKDEEAGSGSMTYAGMEAHGPGGLFNIVALVFAAISVLGLAFAIMGATNTPMPGTVKPDKPDAFRIISALLLCFVALPCALAAFAHEGLTKEVSKVAQQNRMFKAENQKLDAQLKNLGAVRTKLGELEKSMGVDAAALSDMLTAVRKVTCTTQLATVLRAFLEADGGYGNKDSKLQGSELMDFFDSCQGILKEADPSLDLHSFKTAARDGGGIDLYQMRCIVCAVVASVDEASGRSAAMMSLALFSFNPEKHMDEASNKLEIVFEGKKSGAKIGAALQELKGKADPSTGRLDGEHLLELSYEVMASAYDDDDEK